MQVCSTLQPAGSEEISSGSLLFTGWLPYVNAYIMQYWHRITKYALSVPIFVSNVDRFMTDPCFDIVQTDPRRTFEVDPDKTLHSAVGY